MKLICKNKEFFISNNVKLLLKFTVEQSYFNVIQNVTKKLVPPAPKTKRTRKSKKFEKKAAVSMKEGEAAGNKFLSSFPTVIPNDHPLLIGNHLLIGDYSIVTLVSNSRKEISVKVLNPKADVFGFPFVIGLQDDKNLTVFLDDMINFDIRNPEFIYKFEPSLLKLIDSGAKLYVEIPDTSQ